MFLSPAVGFSALFCQAASSEMGKKFKAWVFFLLLSLPAITGDFGASAGALYQQRRLRIPCPGEGQASAASAEPGAELPPA